MWSVAVAKLLFFHDDTKYSTFKLRWFYMEVKIEQGWKDNLRGEFDKDYFLRLTDAVRKEYADPAVIVYPPASRIFAAFDSCPYDRVKVCIIGQDPYHGPGQANGLSFSVNPGVPFPPSLLNIFKEIHDETGAPMPPDGDLSRWARQGVLLLNATLTVREHQPKSHSMLGWQQFTDAAVEALNRREDPMAFLLWGSDAIRKGAGIDRSRHLVLTAPHPSPLSAYRGFFGCGHFRAVNDWLVSQSKSPVQW